MRLIRHHLSPAVSYEQALFSDCLCQISYAYLGRPWRHLPCCRAQCQSRCRGRCYGLDSGGLGKQVRDSGLDKGQTKGIIFDWHPSLWLLFVFTLLDYFIRMNQCQV